MGKSIDPVYIAAVGFLVIAVGGLSYIYGYTLGRIETQLEILERMIYCLR